jgi:hypothetical protein
MNVLYAKPRIKPNRRTARNPAPFGQGILAYRPHTSTPFTATDEAEAAAMFAEANHAPMTFDALMSQIRGDLVRCEALGRRQDALAAKLELSRRGIRTISGGSPEATRFIPSERDLEDVFGNTSRGDDAQFMTAAG